jgi:hypothetical protein
MTVLLGQCSAVCACVSVFLRMGHGKGSTELVCRSTKLYMPVLCIRDSTVCICGLRACVGGGEWSVCVCVMTDVRLGNRYSLMTF